MSGWLGWDWGSVPQWVSGVGTVTALFALKRTRDRDRRDDRLVHAGKVSAYTERQFPQDDSDRTRDLIVHNGGSNSIFAVQMSCHGSVSATHESHFPGDVGPGKEARWTMPDWAYKISIRFTDANGLTWRLFGQGAMSSRQMTLERYVPLPTWKELNAKRFGLRYFSEIERRKRQVKKQGS